jgi:hypothetical protein
MTLNRVITNLAAQTVAIVGFLAMPCAVKAFHSRDSPDVTRLLGEAKAEAVELLHDSDELQTFTRSKLSWKTQGHQIELAKAHINKTGKLLAALQVSKPVAAPWQQRAIDQIDPQLRELAKNTEAMIKHLNENKDRVHMPEFQDYVSANYRMAVDLEALIRDFVNYAEAQQEFERLGHKLGVH